MKKFWIKLKKIGLKILKDIKAKGLIQWAKDVGLISWRGLWSFLIINGICYSPAIFLILKGIFMWNITYILSGITTWGIIALAPLGWLCWVFTLMLLAFWNKKVKKNNAESAINIYKDKKGEYNEDI